ncbi:hypothetical protein V8F20_007030 [Naviculisporaceae sp. PSN 640]
MAPKQMTIPQPFSYLLPAQGLVAGVAIYATIYVFGVGKIPFILAVVAAGLHFLLGVYFCFIKNRLRAHDFFLVPLVLVAGAGVWAGSVYYFAKLLDDVLKLGNLRIGTIGTTTTTSQPEIATWTKVGISMTGLNVLIDIILVIVFIVAASKKSSPYPRQEPTYVPPQVPTPAPAPAPASTFPVASPTTVHYQQPQPQYQQHQQQYYQVATVPVIQQQQQPPAPQRIISTTSSDFKLPIASSISPATSPSPSQQYQPYPQPQTAQYQHQRQPSFPSQQQQQLSSIPQYQQQEQHQQYPPQLQTPQSFSPSPQPPPTPPQGQGQPQPQPQSQSSSAQQQQNRITTLRRLSALQNPQGNWTYTPELASILQLWTGDTISAQTPVYNITVLTHNLILTLREYIWSAQRERREHVALSPAEMDSLKGVNWDLGWVGMGLERAGGWLTQAQGQSQGQGQGQGQIQGGYQ